MDRSPPSPGGLPFSAWLLGVVLLLAWHGWLTQQLFGADPCTNLLSEEPIVSGTHPQSLSLGSLAARAIVEQGRASVYHLDFQAGMPVTPIFDGGRVAGLFLVCGSGHPATVYK